jgi:sugar lactone lactonase YvrE
MQGLTTRSFPFGIACAVLMLSVAEAFAQAGYWITIAGAATTPGSTDGTNAEARFNVPAGIAIDGPGNLYITDQNNDTIRLVTPSDTNWIVSTIAGAAGAPGSADGTNTGARFSHPQGIALDASGNLYVADYLNSTIRKLTRSGPDWVVSTIAGSAGLTGSMDGTNADARFVYPVGVALDNQGTLYVTDSGNTVRSIKPVGTNWVVSTIAGRAPQGGSNDGTNTQVRFRSPAGIAADSVGNLYVCDQANATIRKLTPIGTNWVVTTVAGKAEICGSADGTNNGARFCGPSGITITGSGDMIVTDQYNDIIRKLSFAGTNCEVTTIGGLAGHAGSNDGTNELARFYYPGSVATDARALIYVTDNLNHTIRLGNLAFFPPSIVRQPRSATVLAGSSVSFDVQVSGAPPFSYQWMLGGSNISGATASSLTLTNVSYLDAGSYTVRVRNPTLGVTSDPAQLVVRYLLAFANGQALVQSNYTFIGSVQIQMTSAFPDGIILYTLDGSEPNLSSTYYSGPITLNESAVLWGITYNSNLTVGIEAPPIHITILKAFSLSAMTPGGGRIGLFPPNGPYVSGTTVSLAAFPSNGWSFLQWMGDVEGTNPAALVVMDHDKSVEAIFGTPLNVSTVGPGLVDVSPNLPAYAFGMRVRLGARPAAGNFFLTWRGGANGSVSPLYYVVTNPAPTISALFGALSSNQVSLVLAPEGSGRINATPLSNSYAVGARVMLRAIPDPGQTFLGWSGDASGNASTLFLSLPQSEFIVARFSSRPSLLFDGPLDGFHDSAFRFTLAGEPGNEYSIQISTNLSDWGTLRVITNNFGTLRVSDLAATNAPGAFYRAVQP